MDDLAKQIGDLSRADLIDLARIISEQERAYDENRLETYHPHPGQVEFHSSPHKIRLLITGNRFGKTTASVIEAIWLALGIHPYHPIAVPNRGKLYGESFPMIMETIAVKIGEWLPEKFLAKNKPFVYNQMGALIGVNFANGSVIKIGSYDQQEKKSEGSNWHYVAFDEPPPRNLYVANMRGLVDFGGIMWISATPLSEAWIYDDLWMPGIKGTKPYIKCISGTSDVNPHINKEALALFLDELTEEEKDMRYYGRFSKLKGLCIDTYDSELSDIDPFELDEDFVLYEGIDPHPSKPNAALWKAIDKDGFRYVVGELSCPRGIYQFGQEIADKRRQLTAGGAVLIQSIADSSLNQDDMMFKMNQWDELKKSLRAAGEDVMPQIANKRGWVDAGIAKLKDLYRVVIQKNEKTGEILHDNPTPKQYVFNNLVKYRFELLHYQWPKIPTDNMKPIPKHNEYIDCDRYIESVAPSFQTPGSRFIRNASVGAYQRVGR